MLIVEQKINDAWFAPSRELNIKISMAGEVFDRTSVTSLSFDSGSISGETFQIGSAHMNQIQLEFPSIIQTVQKDLELSVELGILVEGLFHYSKLGTFIVSEFDRNYNDKKTTITAVDKMCLLEGIYQSELTYPNSMRAVAVEIANLSGVEIDQVSYSRIPTTLIAEPVGYTSRQAIGLIAQFIGGFANFNREGKLQVKTLEPTEFIIGPENYLLKGFSKNESKYRINGISVKTGDEESDVLLVGETKGNVIQLENKIMTQDLLNSLWSNVKDIIYYPFELKWQGNPNLEAGDWFYVKDREGTLFSVPNLSYSFTYNGGMRADSKATTTTSSEVTYKYGGTLQQQVKEIFKRLPSANGWNGNHYDSETEPENPRIGDIWFKKNGEAEEIWTYDVIDGSPKWVLKVSSAPNQELKEAIEEVKKIVQETSELAEKNAKQINDALESGEVLSLKDLFARKIGTNEFNTLFYQETNAIGLTYFVDGEMEAIIAIQEGIPLIKGKHIVLDGDTIIDGDFTITGDMLADSAVIDKLKTQGIDAAQINVTNLNANSFTSGDIDALKIRIMAGDVPVMSVDDTGEVIFNVSRLTIGGKKAATNEDIIDATTKIEIDGVNRWREKLCNLQTEVINDEEYWLVAGDNQPTPNNISITGDFFEDNAQYTVQFNGVVGTHFNKAFFRYVDGSFSEKSFISGERDAFTSDAGKTIQHFTIDTGGYQDLGYIKKKTFKIEKGNKATGWTQNPQDAQVEIDEISTGVKNLIPNSRINQTSNEYGFATREFTEQLVAGQDYVLSVNASVDQKTLDDGRYLNVIINEPTWTHGWYSLTFKELSETIKTLTFKPTWTGQYQISFYYYPSDGLRDGLATVNWAKLEKGTRASDWTSAPEDVQAEIDSKADSSNVNHQVSDIWESLNGKLSSSEFETMKEMAEALQESYNQYTDPETGTAYKNLQALEKRIEKIIVDLGNEVASFNFIKTYMKMGEEGFIIGQEGAPMKMILTNNRLSFVDGDKENEVAYFSGQSFYINQGAILKSLQIGTHKTTDLGSGSTVIQWTV